MRDGKRVTRIEKVFTQPKPVGALSPDGDWFVVGGASTELSIIDLKRGQRVRLFGHRYEISCIAFTPDGQRFVTGGVEGLLFSWETTGLHRRKTLGQHPSSVGLVAFSPDGTVLVAQEPGAGLHLWNMATSREVGFIEARDRDYRGWLGVSPDGRWVGLCFNTGEIRVFPVASNSGELP